MKSYLSTIIEKHSSQRRTRLSTLTSSFRSVRRLGSEQLENRTLLAADVMMHNPITSTDVNADGFTTPLDALYIINELNNGGPRSLTTDASLNVNGMFYDVVPDNFITPLDALTVLNSLGGEGEDEDDVVRVRLETTDLDGNVVADVDVGEDFVLRGYVQDLTDRETGGVFAAYFDVLYDETIVSVDGGLEFSATYSNVKSGDLSVAGVMDEVGAIDGLTPLGPDEFLLFSVQMNADADGSVDFVSAPAGETNRGEDVSQLHAMLVYLGNDIGLPGDVPTDRVAYMSTTLSVGEEVEAPQAVDDSYQVDAGTALIRGADDGVLSNDVFSGAAPLTATLVDDVANGTLSLASNGAFSYAANLGFSGADTFTYRAVAGDLTSGLATVTITVVAQNSAPVANDDQYDATEGVPFNNTVSVLANDVDGDGDALIAELFQDATNGTVVIQSDGFFTYTPDADFNGTDSFSYVASDGQATSDPATVTLLVAAVNHAPVAFDDGPYATAMNEPLTISAATGVLANDTDVDGDSLTATEVSSPSNGTLTLASDGSFVYTPNTEFTGTDSFTYVANDGELSSNTATVTVSVAAVNRAPVALDDGPYATAMNESLTISAATGVLANDTDVDGDSLTATEVSPPSNGTLSLASDGSFVYTPNAGFTGADSFTYVANDGELNSNVATAQIVVEDEERVDVNVRLAVTNSAGIPISSISPGGEFLLVAFVQDIGVLPRDGVFAAYLDVVYDSGLVSVSGPIAFNGEYVNLPSGDTSVPGIIDEVGAFADISPLGDGEFMLFNVPMRAEMPGQANIAGNPAEDQESHQILLFGENTPVPVAFVDYGSVQIEILAGDPPVAVDDAYTGVEDQPIVVDPVGVLENDSDPDGSALVAVLETGPSNGSLNLNPAGSFTYVPDANFHGTDSFTYRASDGALLSNPANVTLQIDPADDAPVARDDVYRVTNAGGIVVTAELGVLANDSDVDGDELSAVLVSGTSNGSLTLVDDGGFTYIPDEDFIGIDMFTYVAVANGVESAPAQVTIEVGNTRPSSVTGYVYADPDHNGVMEENDVRFGGVKIRLRGEDLLGNLTTLVTHTEADGSYRFDNLMAGTYTVTEFQPMQLLDGKDTVDGQLSLRNDRFVIDLPGGVTAGDYNFGERGLAPTFIRDTMFFASREQFGFLTMMNLEGETDWYAVGAGWSGLEEVDATLDQNKTAVNVSIEDRSGGTDSERVALDVDRDARLLHGPEGSGMLVKLVGNAASFGLVPDQLQAEAVDQAFGGDDA